jgi:hypothetical protein
MIAVPVQGLASGGRNTAIVFWLGLQLFVPLAQKDARLEVTDLRIQTRKGRKPERDHFWESGK